MQFCFSMCLWAYVTYTSVLFFSFLMPLAHQYDPYVCITLTENICFEVIDNVRHCLNTPRSDSQIFRAKFSGKFQNGSITSLNAVM